MMNVEKLSLGFLEKGWAVCFSHRAIAFLLLLTASFLSLANEPYSFLDSDENRLITSYFQYIEDKDSSFNHAEVLNRQDWINIEQDSINFGVTKSTFWLRTFLKNPSTEDLTRYIEISTPKISFIDFYTFKIQKNENPLLINHTPLGIQDIVRTRSIKSSHPVLPITLAPNEELLILIRGQNPIFEQAYPIRIWKKAEYNEHIEHFFLFQGIFLGCMLAMFFYNFFIFLSTKDISFLFYIGFIAGSILFALFERGFMRHYLEIDHVEREFQINSLSSFFMIIMALRFSDSYLGIARSSRNRKYIVRSLEIGLSCNVILAAINPSSINIYITMSLIFPGFIFLLYIGLRLWYEGQIAAKYYTYAWGIILSGGFVYALVLIGLLPFNLITQNILQVANMFEALLLSFGLGYRIHVLRLQKEEAQAEGLKIKEDKRKEKIFFEESQKARSQFFASMSHEFRTPLTAVLGYVEMAQHPDLNSDERLEHIRVVENSAKHMLHLINDVLDLSKIEAQKLEMNYEEVLLLQLSSEIQNLMQVLADQKGIRFAVTFSYPIPQSIKTDPTRLKQALLNLCSNAIKFTHEGEVSVLVSFKQPDTISFAVKDSGIGIKPEQLEKLFAAFSQAESTTSIKYGGTGLGLHLSKSITNKLGGDITVESEFGRGSTFTLTIRTENSESLKFIEEEETEVNPIEAVAKNVATSSNSSNSSNSSKDTPPLTKVTDFKNRKVLLAEDNPVNRKLVSTYINKIGAELDAVEDALEAISLLLRNEYALLLIDVEMPIMDGLTCVKMLREKGFDLPIYALTGNVDEQSIEGCLLAGCNGHISKPIDIENFNRILLETLHQQGSPST